MANHSIAETGAKPGDTVRCITSNEPARYNKGQEFKVIDFCGTPSVWPNSAFSKEGKQSFMIPFRGYGATWELARPTSGRR